LYMACSLFPITPSSPKCAVTMPLGGVFQGFVQTMTAKRQEAANMINSGDNEKKSKGESLKEFAKLNVNSSYGKMIQNDENFDESTIVKNRKEFLKKTVKKQIIDFNILAPVSKEHEGMIEVKLKRNEVEIKSPRYIGCTVLWYSKMLMLDFIYNCLYQVDNNRDGGTEKNCTYPL